MTAIVAFSHHAARQAEWRSTRGHAGNPVTAILALLHPPVRTELRLHNAIAGNPVTTTLAFARPPIRTELRSTHAQAGRPMTARFVFPKLPTQTASLRWETNRKAYTTAEIRYSNDYRNFVTASIGYCYDWRTIVIGAALRYQHRSLVQAGWRIIAKNIETGESTDLGFIDASDENPALEDVFLPDGEYEISVLTSSLFWKDCLDRTVRTISIRPGEEVTPLPTIYNLRSAVLDGVTTIRWSANRSDLEDCGFGVWYSLTSPVPTDGAPTETVWYFSELTEYQTSFKQFSPCYVAVAALRPGNEPGIGKVHELFLDWRSTPPRPPDDVVVLDRFQTSDGRIPNDLRPPGNVYFENF